MFLINPENLLMKLIRGTQLNAGFANGTVATIGNFDGVHLGHQNLLRVLKDKARQKGLPLVVILFEPQPREYFHKEQAPARISSLREKLDMLKKCDVNYVYCIKFDHVMAHTNAFAFAKEHLFHHLRVKYLLIGEDFRFGKNREGNVELLRQIGANNSCDVVTFSDFCIENERVSSTKIREALKLGHLDVAKRLLGRNYSMCGRVIHGDGRGRQWGIPTANLSLHRLEIPLTGVFAVEVTISSKKALGVANIGKRPTVDGTRNVLEVHLFDFDYSIYGELMQVNFLHKIRDEVKFTTIDALITQIHHDISAAKNIFNLRIV